MDLSDQVPELTLLFWFDQMPDSLLPSLIVITYEVCTAVVVHCSSRTSSRYCVLQAFAFNCRLCLDRSSTSESTRIHQLRTDTHATRPFLISLLPSLIVITAVRVHLILRIYKLHLQIYHDTKKFASKISMYSVRTHYSQ